MNLNDAIAAVDTIISGKRTNKPFDWWERAEQVLRESGDIFRAEIAHDAAIRAYRFEEWQADLA
jgi:hypothetical protein